jgi:polysaccharide deacetylase 2 family uncharacterized protein YibQ
VRANLEDRSTLSDSARLYPPLNRDLHAPLGQNRRTAPKSGFPLRRIAMGASWLAGLIVVGGISAYPWFYGQSLPGAWMPPPQKEAAKPANPGGAPGANPGPDLNSLAKSTGQQGANVVAQTMDDGSVVTTYSPKPRDGSGPLLISNSKTQEPRLAGLPNLDLIEDTPDGKLPKVGPDGLRPFDYYARPWSGARGTRIAIVVSGLGISQTGTMRAVRDLPEEVTLAFAANGNSLSRWVPEARRNGHEVLLQVPMEPFDYPDNNPGPGTLVTSKGSATNLANLHQDMARMDSYTGIMNYLGGKFLSDPDALQPIMRDIASRGLMFLDDGSTAQSLSGQMAGALSMPHAFASLTLDSEVNETAILKRLDDLERMAARNGSAIGVAAGFDESISAIKKWVDEAQGRGIEIVGVSALADAPANN